jgi:hypothetical protein
VTIAPGEGDRNGREIGSLLTAGYTWGESMRLEELTQR